MTVDIDRLGQMVRDHRGTKGVRAAAKEIGVSPATLSRIENGHVPDVEKFAAICRWLNRDPGEFLGMQKAQSPEGSAIVHLRKKQTTTVDTATALGGVILAAQRALRDLDDL